MDELLSHDCGTFQAIWDAAKHGRKVVSLQTETRPVEDIVLVSGVTRRFNFSVTNTVGIRQNLVLSASKGDLLETWDLDNCDYRL